FGGRPRDDGGSDTPTLNPYPQGGGRRWSCRVSARSIPQFSEKIGEHGFGAGGGEAGDDFGAVVAGGLVKEANAVLHRAGLDVLGGEIDAAETGVGDGAGTHG